MQHMQGSARLHNASAHALDTPAVSVSSVTQLPAYRWCMCKLLLYPAAPGDLRLNFTLRNLRACTQCVLCFCCDCRCSALNVCHAAGSADTPTPTSSMSSSAPAFARRPATLLQPCPRQWPPALQARTPQFNPPQASTAATQAVPSLPQVPCQPTPELYSPCLAMLTGMQLMPSLPPALQ